MSNLNLLAVFLTGLTTGGLTCLAIQGGLLTSVIAKQEADLHSSNKFIPIVSFLTGKLFIHTILGFLLGLLGSVISLTPIFRGWLQILIGIYLLGIAGNLLNLHPFFRYFVITPPKFLARLARSKSKSQSIFAPFLLGLLTVFIPCAVTQATEVVAIGTSNPLYGAAIMFAFVLGTTPTFLIFGFLLNSGAKLFQKYFPIIAAVALFGMAVYSINNGIGLTGSVYTIQNFIEAAQNRPADDSILGANVQTAVITVTNGGYTPQVISLKKDIPVQLTLKTIDVQSCSRSFTIPALNIQRLLPESGETVIEFTPTDLGPLAFSCSMGMYTGRFNVIN
jgi:sulfite exporter TauE/SafE